MTRNLPFLRTLLILTLASAACDDDGGSNGLADGGRLDATTGGMDAAGGTGPHDAATDGPGTTSDGPGAKQDGPTTADASGDGANDGPGAVAAIWPADATKLVAEDLGGGFGPQPPAGSTCQVGAATFTFTVADLGLTFRRCLPSAGAGSPYQWKDGQRTLTNDERARIVTAVGKVKLTGKMICGADKSVRQMTVTTPAGSKTYLDSFYACEMKGVYVDNIDEVFAVLSMLIAS